MKDILLLTTQDCHLCLYAREMISEVDLKEYNLIEVDIYSKRDYVDRFWDKIPVLLMNEKAFSFINKTGILSQNLST
mgnify:CR=1 FL=1